MAATTVRAIQEDMLDLIAWKRYGRSTQSTEAMLENPNNYRLCDADPVLEIGNEIYLPDIIFSNDRRIIKIWD